MIVTDIAPSKINLQSQPIDHRFLRPREMRFPASMTLEEWANAFNLIDEVDESLPWWRGDWVRWGRDRFGEDWTQYLPEDDRKIKTYQNNAWVADRVQPPRRRANLTYSHHAVVAALEPEQQDEWLDRAEGNEWTVNQFRDALVEAEVDQSEVDIVETITIPIEPVKAAYMIVMAFPAKGALELAKIIQESVRV